MPHSPYEILLGHNLWATRVVLQAAAALDADAFQQRFEIGPGSLHDTLRHIVGAMLRWADRIADRPLRASIEADGRLYTARELLTLSIRRTRSWHRSCATRPRRAAISP